MAKLLFVSKDPGGTRMLISIAKEAKNRGHDVFVAAEGNGGPLWFRAGIEPFFLGTHNFEIIPFSLNAEALLKDIKPDAVVLELPGPVNITKNIGLEANKRGIPVVMVEDYWACRKRLPEVEPSLVLTIDEYAKRIAEEAVKFQVPVEIIGNHAVIDLQTYQPLEQVVKTFREARKRFDELFVYDGGNVVEADLRLLIPSLLLTPGNWGLIPRYHPNRRDRIAPCGRKFSDVWDAMLDPIRERVVRCDIGTSSDMAILADAMFSAFGSAISTAITAGKPAVILQTTESAASLKESYLEEIPWVALGAAPAIEEQQNLRPLLIPPLEESKNKFFPIQPKKAIEAIEKFFLVRPQQ